MLALYLYTFHPACLCEALAEEVVEFSLSPTSKHLTSSVQVQPQSN